MSSSISLVNSGYTLFFVLAWCLVSGFVGLIIAATTVKSSGKNRSKMLGVIFPTMKESYRLAFGFCAGAFLGFLWGGSELNSIEKLGCEEHGLRLKSGLTERIIYPKDGVQINLLRVDLRGSSPFRVEFNVDSKGAWKTVRLSIHDAEHAKTYARQCLKREN